jgi:hypothetical protein
VLVAGVTYKRDIDDVRESPALDVLGLLRSRGATVCYADPFVPRLEAREWGGDATLEGGATPAALAAVDCVVIVTDHSRFDYGAIAAHAPLVVDTRNAVTSSAPHVLRLGAPGTARPAPRTTRRPWCMQADALGVLDLARARGLRLRGLPAAAGRVGTAAGARAPRR